MLRLRRTACDLHLIAHHFALNRCLRKNRNNGFRRPDIALNFVRPFDADLHMAVDKNFVSGFAQAPLQQLQNITVRLRIAFIHQGNKRLGRVRLSALQILPIRWLSRRRSRWLCRRGRRWSRPGVQMVRAAARMKQRLATGCAQPADPVQQDATRRGRKNVEPLNAGQDVLQRAAGLNIFDAHRQKNLILLDGPRISRLTWGDSLETCENTSSTMRPLSSPRTMASSHASPPAISRGAIQHEWPFSSSSAHIRFAASRSWVEWLIKMSWGMVVRLYTVLRPEQ